MVREAMSRRSWLGVLPSDVTSKFQLEKVRFWATMDRSATGVKHAIFFSLDTPTSSGRKTDEGKELEPNLVNCLSTGKTFLVISTRSGGFSAEAWKKLEIPFEPFRLPHDSCAERLKYCHPEAGPAVLLDS